MWVSTRVTFDACDELVLPALYRKLGNYPMREAA
jgi:hypothetical protein